MTAEAGELRYVVIIGPDELEALLVTFGSSVAAAQRRMGSESGPAMTTAELETRAATLLRERELVAEGRGAGFGTGVE